MLLPKCVEVLLLDGRVEIIYRPQQEYNELPESIRANDGLDGELSISYVFIWIIFWSVYFQIIILLGRWVGGQNPFVRRGAEVVLT